MTDRRKIRDNVLVRYWVGIPSVVALAIIAFLFVGNSVEAADPAPVNPPGPLPQFMTDADGNRFEVFTPEEGGAISGDGFSFIAEPGDVPSATFVGIRLAEGGEASNLGMTHHRYTTAGNYYVVDALDEDGKRPDPRFALRNPAEACVPMPKVFSANIVDVRLVATDVEGISQTVLNSGVKVFGGELMVCGYVGAVPTVLATGLEGAPGPAVPTPELEPTTTLPATGGAESDGFWLVLAIFGGLALATVGLVFSARDERRG